MKIAMFILPLFYIAGNSYLFLKIWQVMNCMPMWCKVIASIIFWIIAFSLFIVIGLRNTQVPDILLRSMFRIGSVWIVFLLYMVILLAVFDLIGIFVPIMKQSLLYALLITLAILLFGYINYKNPKVEHINITLQKESVEKELRIVAISDVHLGYGTNLSALNDYVQLINSQKPDLILIAGDLIDNSLKPLRREPFAEHLSTLEAPLGIYMVPGNHEYISGIEECIEFLQETPIKILQDSVITLPGGIQLIGRDDRFNQRRENLADLMDKVDKSLPIIVLDHQPYELSKVDSLGADIQISGHTHHGQIWPFNLITDHMFEQSHGYRKWSHSHIWVSSGLSLWGPPFRIGTNSDMLVIDLK